MSSSVGRNSLIMASGTAASRITGQIRTILLAAALGTTGMAANAYQAGAMIPQVIYTLVSGGVFNAVLVPQIVRTLKAKDAEERLNKLITFAIVLLAAVTVLMACCTPLLARMYVNGSPQLIALTEAFTLWCMPQIFFYGLYTVIGQVLAAKNHFATYAWSSVGANVISCIGFVAFIVMFGNGTEEPLAFWTQDKLLLTAGMWTLGVAFQALILFAPLRRIGIHYRFKWGPRGIGLRQMGPVAAWSLGIVVVDQLANVLITRVTTSAPQLAESNLGLSQFDVAGNATYQNASTIYLLPYSLIAVSVATAIFPQISAAVADRRIDAAREDLSDALRSVGTIMFFFTAAFLVMPLSITRALLPSVAVKQALLICAPLMALGVALPLTSAYLIIQRTFYAFEDGKSPFIFMCIFNGLQLALMYLLMAFLPATQWVTVVALSSTLSYIISFVPLVFMLRKRFERRLDGKRIASAYVKAFVAAAAATVAGLLLRQPVYSLLGIEVGADDGSMSWVQSLGSAALLGIALAIVYFGALWLMRSDELMSVVALVRRKLPGGAKATGGESQIPAEETLAEPLNEVEELGPPVPAELAEIPSTGAGNMATAASAHGGPSAAAAPAVPAPTNSTRHREAEETMKPHLGDTVLNRYTLVSPLREEPGLQVWKASDRVLSRDCQLFIVNNRAVLPSVNAVAGALALSRNPRFTQVFQLQHDGDVAIVLTQIDQGLSLSQYIEAMPQRPMTYEAMRSIIADTCKALMQLHHDHLTHKSISTDTVRLTKSGVQLADTPVSAALSDLSGCTPGSGDERLAVCQLAATLYCLIVREPSRLNQQFSLDKLPADLPMEFRAICKRGLNLAEPGTRTVPLLTLAELEALLGAPKPMHALSRTDVRLPGIEGECSIVSAPVKPVLPSDIIPLPESLASSETMPSLVFNAINDPLADVGPLIDEEEDENPGEKTEAMQAAGFKSLWSASKAMMEGKPAPDTGTTPEINPSDATEMFTAFTGDEPESPLQPNRMTVSMDVSGIRDGSRDLVDSINSTGRIPVIGPDGKVVPPGAESQRALDEERRQINETYDAGLAALPPSYAPQSSPAKATLPTLEDDDGKKKHRGRLAVIIVVIVALVAALGVAVHSLATGGSLFGFLKEDDTSYWPSMNLNDVPFGSRTGEDASEDQPTPTKSPTATESPSPTESATTTNTTPYTVASQKFLNEPNGQQGYGYYLHLSQQEEVSRVVITIRSSGGTGYIRVNTAGDPTQGEQVAQFTFAESGTTDVVFDKAVKTQDIVLWVPIDSLPGNQLYIESMKAY